jgi:hypothetical protein
MMKAARTSETSVDNHFTRQYIPEDNSELHTRRRENLKSHFLTLVFDSLSALPGRGIGKSQGLCVYTNINALSGIRYHNPSIQPLTAWLHRVRGHYYRLRESIPDTTRYFLPPCHAVQHASPPFMKFIEAATQ